MRSLSSPGLSSIGPLSPRRAQPAHDRADLLDGHLGLADEAHEASEVRARGQQDRARRQAVAARAAGLLVVGLEARRQRPVPDRAHVGLVDAHAERVRGDDDVGVPAHERVLARRARPGVHPGVVGDGAQILGGEQRGDLLGALAGAAVHDGRSVLVPSPGRRGASRACAPPSPRRRRRARRRRGWGGRSPSARARARAGRGGRRSPRRPSAWPSRCRPSRADGRARR